MKSLIYALVATFITAPALACDRELAIVTAKITVVEQYEKFCKVYASARTVLSFERHLTCGVAYSVFLSEGVEVPNLNGVCTLKVDDTLAGMIVRDHRGTYKEP